MSKQRDRKCCRGFKRKSHETAAISYKIHSDVSHLLIKQRQPKKLGEILLCWTQLWELSLSLSSGVSCFSCRRPGWPFPSSFPHQCSGADCELTPAELVEQHSPHCWGLLWSLSDAVSDRCSLWQKISTSRAFACINCQFAASEDLPLLWSLKGGTSAHFWCTGSSWEVWAPISTFPLFMI